MFANFDTAYLGEMVTWLKDNDWLHLPALITFGVWVLCNLGQMIHLAVRFAATSLSVGWWMVKLPFRVFQRPPYVPGKLAQAILDRLNKPSVHFGPSCLLDGDFQVVFGVGDAVVDVMVGGIRGIWRLLDDEDRLAVHKAATAVSRRLLEEQRQKECKDAIAALRNHLRTTCCPPGGACSDCCPTVDLPPLGVAVDSSSPTTPNGWMAVAGPDVTAEWNRFLNEQKCKEADFHRAKIEEAKKELRAQKQVK